MNNAPLLDRNFLLEVTDGDVAFERELLGTYRASAENTLARLRAALTAAELSQITREAHALKGACLNVGATALAQVASGIENAARAGDLTLARQAAGQLDDQAAALWAELDRM